MLKSLKKLIARLKGRAAKYYRATYVDMYATEPRTENFRASNLYNTITTPPVVMMNNMSHADNIAVAQPSVTQEERDATVSMLKKRLPEDIRIEKKPVDVVSEIVASEPVLRLNDIDKQIEIVEARLAVLRQFKGQTSDEVYALLYLNARRYYEKAKKKGLFPWAVTTDALIKALVDKYKLQNVSFSGYSKSVPIEATRELEKFGKAWEYVVDDESHTPELRLITDYQGPEHKKDPILLASSPFGKWWYVLGAWDAEVEIVDEIIYHGK